MAKDLFLEIGCEEIPAGFVPKAMADMETLVKRELENARIEFGEVVTLGTPRRLVLAVKGIAGRQPDAELTAMGPAKGVAYDADGNPTKAAQGFARGQGIDVSQLKLVMTEKGEYLAAVKSEVEFSTYNFEEADVDMLLTLFKMYEKECVRLVEKGLVLPAYDYVMKCSHTFNLLDARGAISVTERASYIGKVRNVARLCAEGYLQMRERLGFPLLKGGR